MKVVGFLFDLFIFTCILIILFSLLWLFFARFNVLSGTMNVIQILSFGIIVVASFGITASISDYRRRNDSLRFKIASSILESVNKASLKLSGNSKRTFSPPVP